MKPRTFSPQPPPPTYTKVLPGQPRDIIFPAYPGSTLGPPPIKTCMEHLTHEVSRRHSCKMPESCQLIPFQSIQRRRPSRSDPWLLRLGHVRIWDKCLRSIVRSSSAPHHKQQKTIIASHPHVTWLPQTKRDVSKTSGTSSRVCTIRTLLTLSSLYISECFRLRVLI